MPRKTKKRARAPRPLEQSHGGRRMAIGVGVAAVALFAVTWALSGHGGATAGIIDRQVVLDASPLADVSLGRPNAPVTIVEYASMTCGHCANFTINTFPEVQRRLIDTGAARFVLREFPLDPVAMAGAMVARCAGPDHSFEAAKRLFETQATWVQAPDRTRALAAIASPYGMTEQDVRTCLADTDLQRQINAVKTSGSDLGVRSTPTFFVDGEMIQGAAGFDRLYQAVQDARSRKAAGAASADDAS